MLSSSLHLLALTVYLGSVIGLWVILLPALSALREHGARVKFFARGLRLYNPWQTGALGVLLISGALQVTVLKATYRELFMKELGLVLGLKLALSFVLIILSTYQTMGVAHRFVKRCEGEEAVTPQDLDSVTRRLRYLTLAIVPLAMITALVGTRLRG